MSKDKDDLIAGDDRKLIPEGKYSAQCAEVKKVFVGQRTTNGTYARTPKVVLTFNLIEGEFEGEKVLMYLNANYKPFPAGSKFYQCWIIAAGRKPARRDRMSLDVFESHIFTVAVKTVKPKFNDGREMPETLWYSRIDEIYEKCA